MSVEQVRAALECRADIPQTAAHVLLILATYADPEGRRAFPSVATIARQAHMDERTARRCLRLLETAGLIALQERSLGRLPACYRLTLDPGRIAPSTPGGTPPGTAPSPGTQSERGGTQSVYPGHSAPQSVMDQSVKQDAGARAREDAARPREWRDEQGRLYASPGNGAQHHSAGEALALERQQREARAKAAAVAPGQDAPRKP